MLWGDREKNGQPQVKERGQGQIGPQKEPTLLAPFLGWGLLASSSVRCYISVVEDPQFEVFIIAALTNTNTVWKTNKDFIF